MCRVPSSVSSNHFVGAPVITLNRSVLSRLRIVGLLSLGLIVPIRDASASPITFTFEGTITSSAILGVVVGNTYTGSITWDDAVTDSFASDPTRGEYRSANTAPYGYTFTSGLFSSARVGASFELVM